MSDIDPDHVKLFARLFPSNDRSYGQFEPSTHKMWMDEGRYRKAHIENHLKGKVGLGLVPITDEDTCSWAAIDIDAHEEHEEIDLINLERRVKELDLPLTVCRTKSAGAHCYVFFVEPEPCEEVIQLLGSWTAALGYPGHEVFPKQKKLSPSEDGTRPFGNWINLPYINGNNTDRWAIEGGKKVSLDYFLQLADSRRVRLQDIMNKVQSEHPDAPPCFQRMAMGLPGKGARNNAIYNATIYYKRVDPDNYTDKVIAFNEKSLVHPLDEQEVRKTIKSAARRDYSYKCQEKPIVDYCDRELCVKRKFGIKPHLLNKALPKFSNLRKYTTSPVYWELNVDGKTVVAPTKTLLSWWLFRELVFEVTLIPPPQLKKNEWDAILAELSSKVEVIHPPDDASTRGILYEKLMDFLQKADIARDDPDRRRILRGVPIAVTTRDSEGKNPQRYIAWRMRDFVTYLKKQRFEEFKGSKLYMALKNYGIESSKLKIDGSSTAVWMMKIEEFDKLDSPIKHEMEY